MSKESIKPHLLARDGTERLEIVEDKVNKIITYGGLTIKEYTKLSVYTLERIVGVFPLNHKHYKDSIEFTKRTKLTPTVAKKLLYAKMSSMWINDYKDILNLCGCGQYAGKFSWNVRKVQWVHQNLSMIKQTIQDGQKNILPLVTELELSPKEIKDNLSKKEWKRLLKRSHWWCKNASLCIRGRDSRLELLKTLIPTEVPLDKLFGAPTKGTLKFYNTYGHKRYTVKYLKTKEGWGTWIKDRNTFADTNRMAEQLGLQNNTKTIENLYKKHEEFTKLINLRKYSKDEFNLRGTVLEKLPKYLEINGIACTYLNSKYLIQQEGVEMHHCVSSYADRAANLDYLVFSLSGVERSTVGFIYNKAHNQLIPDQHYSYNNSKVSRDSSVVCGELFNIIQKVISQAKAETEVRERKLKTA